MDQQQPGTACYLVSEANGTRSRDVVTLAQGHNCLPGTVLGNVPVDPTNGTGEGETPDGSHIAVVVLFAAVDATAGDKPAVITARDAEVEAAALIWPAAITPTQKTAALGQLAAVGIVAR